MALWIAQTGLSLARYYFMLNLLNQLTSPNWPTSQNYVYSSDFMWNSKTTFVNGVEKTIPSACVGGPNGQLPEFDFIVVGSGPGGSVPLILVVEAGSEAPVNVAPPGMFPFNLKIEGTQAYHANPSNSYGHAFINGVKLVFGRALGGTSNTNAMLLVCGNEFDFNSWANITNDSSWNEQNMRPHVKNIMKMHDPTPTEDQECSSFYGTEGELNVGPYYGEAALTSLFEYAAISRGHRYLKDINCGKWTGYAKVRGTIYNGERQTASKAFLAPLKDHKNLLILQNAVVDKILVDDSNGSDKIKVKGVRVVTKNQECPSFELKAKSEIILSAGAFNTPLILQRSGIGRAADLTPFNIQQKLDLNVGHNYRDHLLSFHVLTIPSQPFSDEYMQNEAYRYFTARQGQFAYLSTIDFNIFINHDDPTSNIPNNQWMFLTFAAQQTELEQILKFHLEIKPEFADQILALNQENAVTLLVNTLSLPKSSGYVGIRSTNPYDEPSVDGNYLSDPDDLRLTIKGIREMQNFVNTPVMQLYGAQLRRLDIPECDTLTYDSDDYWKCYLKYFTQTEWHPSGTARMGDKKDKNAVVDSRLKVIGVQGRPGLRVSDASVTPQVTTGNSQCTIYAIADKAAKMIIEDNN